MLAAPLIEPRIVGVKKRPSVHVPPLPAMLPPQGFVPVVKSPLIVMTIGCADAPLFVIVTFFTALVVSIT